MDAAVPVTKKVEVKGEVQMMELVDMTEPAASPEYSRWMAEAMRKVRNELYVICLFHNVDFRMLLWEQERTHGVFVALCRFDAQHPTI